MEYPWSLAQLESIIVVVLSRRRSNASDSIWFLSVPGFISMYDVTDATYATSYDGFFLLLISGLMQGHVRG